MVQIATMEQWLTPSQVLIYIPGGSEAHMGLVSCPEKSDGLGRILTQDLLIPKHAAYPQLQLLWLNYF